MEIIPIDSVDDERVQVYSKLTEAQLRNKLEPDKGIFIAESPKVIEVALKAGFRPISLLCEEKHLKGDASVLLPFLENIPIYIGKREVLAQLTGYVLTRGVLCAMCRPSLPTVAEVCADARRVVVIDGVVDTTNIGAIFRSAAALGMDGILLTRTSCDPLNRRAVRVSMGSVFLIPWTWIESPLDELSRLNFKTVAMALRDDSIALDAESLKREEKLALIMGTEGDGLADTVINGTDYVVKIPMYHGVDSLNVAAASAVAFWELGKR